MEQYVQSSCKTKPCKTKLYIIMHQSVWEAAYLTDGSGFPWGGTGVGGKSKEGGFRFFSPAIINLLDFLTVALIFMNINKIKSKQFPIKNKK